MTTSVIHNIKKPGRSSSVFALLIVERVLHAICMGAATLLPSFFLTHGLNEIYFGATSAASAVVAVLIILVLPIFMEKIRADHLAQASGLFMSAGYGLLLYANLAPSTLQFIGFLALPLISAGWVTHFTLGSIRISTAASNASRQQSFMIYAAFSTFGMSLGPIIGKFILSLGANHTGLFSGLIILSAGALFASSVVPGGDATRPAETVSNTKKEVTADRLSIIRSPAVFFVGMVFLQSAIFTVILNFQVVFSDLNGLASSVFFLCWAIGIMVPRLVFGGWIAKQNNCVVLPLLTTVLAISLFALAAGPTTNFYYGLTALSLGVSYGLSYPIVQAETVKFASISTRDLFLVAFSLSYFLSYYLTPFAAGVLVSIKGYNMLFGAAGLIAMMMTFASLVFYRNPPTVTMQE